MKKHIFNGLINLSFIVLFFEILFNKTLIIDTISFSLDTWVNNLIPSMFPFFIISDILISYQIINYIPGFLKKDFKKVIKNLKQDRTKFFYNNADTIYDLCEKYQINEFFFCGLISAESGWNIASNHRRTHNYISLMSKGKLITYSSTKEGLEVAAKKLHQNYLTPGGKFYGGKTIAGVQKRFCPASSTWDDLVYSGMKYMLSAAKKTK